MIHARYHLDAVNGGVCIRKCVNKGSKARDHD